MIRHGFIRSESGKWYSLNDILNFSIKDETDYEGYICFDIVAVDKNNEFIYISEYHKSLEEAQEHLDKIMNG